MEQMWGIWDKSQNDWLRELPSKVNDGGIAVLAFKTKTDACTRAAQHFGFDTYKDAKDNDWCEVKTL